MYRNRRDSDYRRDEPEYEEDYYSEQQHYGHGGHGDYKEDYYQYPDAVAKFIIHLYGAITNRDIGEIEKDYEIRLPALTRDYFKEEKWPQDIAHLLPVDNDTQEQIHMFTTLYKELCYRHIYAVLPSTLTFFDRCSSYSTYCEFFNRILTAPEPIELTLTNQWLWEIIDEFVYQFQSYVQYRRSPNLKLSPIEIDYVKEHPYIWNVLSCLNVFHSLIDKSNINLQLKAYVNNVDNTEQVAGEFGKSPLYKMLGYFSLIALLRVHSMLGDFHLALKVLENIDLHKNTMYCNVPACQITTYYYVGFCYVMMRRYADAIRTYTNALLYIQRMRQMFQTKSYQNDQVNKQTDQMYTMLAVCLVLHPQSIDESINSVLQDRKFADKIARLMQGDLKEFENCFVYACPKFLSPVLPSLDGEPDSIQEPLQIQKTIFLQEVAQQLYLPTIRSFLKLYTTMPISKLSAFMDLENENLSLNECLLCFKHKNLQIQILNSQMANKPHRCPMCDRGTKGNWNKGVSSLEGEFQAGSEVNFYIDKDMIHIADTKVGRRYGDYFIRQLSILYELNRSLKGLKF